MGKSTQKRRNLRALQPRWYLAINGALGIAVALTACSSPSSEDGSGSSNGAGASSGATSPCSPAAADFLKKYSEPPTTLPPELKPLKKAPAKGATLIRLFSTRSPSDTEIQKAVEAAAATAGWQATGLSFDGTVADMRSKLDEAIAKKPTAIMAPAGTEPSAIQSSLDAAKAAGILVHIGYVTTPPNSFPGYGAASVTPATQVTVGKIAANWAIIDSNCKANVVIFNLAGSKNAKVGSDAFEAELKANCPDCKSSYNEQPITAFGTSGLTQTVVSTLQAKPDAGYLFLTLGNFNDGLPAAMRQAGLSKVRIFGLVPDTSCIQGLVQKTNAMWVANAPTNLGWIQVDAVLRTIDNGVPTTDDVLPGIYMMTQDNINGADKIPTYPTDLKEQFAKLWLVG